jgi:hypothetical protein
VPKRGEGNQDQNNILINNEGKTFNSEINFLNVQIINPVSKCKNSDFEKCTSQESNKSNNTLIFS